MMTYEGSELVNAASVRDLRRLTTLVKNLESKHPSIQSYLDTVSGFSALHWAAKNNDAAVAEFLLMKGANPNIRFVNRPMLAYLFLSNEEPILPDSSHSRLGNN